MLGVKTALISLLFIGLLAPCLPVQAQAVRGVRVVGDKAAIIKGDQSKARQRAIRSSLQQALEQTVAGFLDTDVRQIHLKALERNIYRRASQFVRSYRVVWEYPDLQQRVQVYRVELEVEVSVEAVARALSRLGLG